MSRSLRWSLILAVLIAAALVSLILSRGGGPPPPGVEEDGAGSVPPDQASLEAPVPGDAVEGDAAVDGAAEPAAPDGARPLSISGRVITTDNAGIAGAHVYAIPTRSWSEFTLGLQRRLERVSNPFDALEEVRRVFEEERGKVPHVRSARDGAYAFRGLAPGEYRLLAVHPEYLPETGVHAVVGEALATTGSSPRGDSSRAQPCLKRPPSSTITDRDPPAGAASRA